MQWHWGNIGSALAGLSTVLIAVAALRHGPAAVRAWIDGKKADAEKVREEAEDIRLERQRHLSGWSAHGVATYGVILVTEADELAQAARELAGGKPTEYVVLRLDEGGQGNTDRAYSLRELVEDEGYLSRAPTRGELEALRNGLDAMGTPRSSF
jgi:hypothetical protein